MVPPDVEGSRKLRRRDGRGDCEGGKTGEQRAWGGVRGRLGRGCGWEIMFWFFILRLCSVHISQAVFMWEKFIFTFTKLHTCKKTAMCRKSLELLQKGGESELRADFLQSQDIGHIKCCGLQGGPHGLLLSASFSLSLCAGSEHVSTMPLFLKNN